jgi:hypothetical protein
MPNMNTNAAGFIHASNLTDGLIALIVRLVFNVFPHETDVSARAIKEF